MIKPKIIKYESLEPKIVKSDIDKIEFLQDQIREYKRQIKILKKALEEAKKKRFDWKYYFELSPGTSPSLRS